jgi:hypothetical protein
MIKHIVAIIVLSIVIVLTMSHLQPVLVALLSAHNWIGETLKEVFSGGMVGDVIRQLIALLCIPLLAGFIPAAIYWLAKRSWFPYFMDFVWVTWLVETAALIIRYAPTSPAAS